MHGRFAICLIVLVAAREELLKSRGEGFVYTPLVGDREPPLDYRE